jgi:hypothetical protein
MHGHDDHGRGSADLHRTIVRSIVEAAMRAGNNLHL